MAKVKDASMSQIDNDDAQDGMSVEIKCAEPECKQIGDFPRKLCGKRYRKKLRARPTKQHNPELRPEIYFPKWEWLGNEQALIDQFGGNS